MTNTDAGKIFYLMGASGAGKDSLLQYLRQHFSKVDNIIFAHRYITRPPALGAENHVALSNKEFEQRVDHHCFAMHWKSHEYQYGIGIEINDWRNKGLHVIVNGSRAYLDKALAIYPDLSPIMIQVSSAILKHRLELRGRETSAEIRTRLQRAEQYNAVSHHNIAVVHNNSSLQEAGHALMQLITHQSFNQ